MRLKTSTYLLGAAAAILMAPFARAGEAADNKTVTPVPPPAPPKVDFLLNVQFSNEYVTPRGMIVHYKDLTIEPLLLGFVSFYQNDDTFINSVKFTGGMWGDFTTKRVSKHPPFGSGPKTNFTEIDPIVELSLGFAKHFELDVTYTAFVEQILDIGTSHHLQTQLSYDDSYLFGGFGLHPYFAYWQELSGKATDADVPEAVFGPSPKSGSHPNPGSSYYFDVGIDPTYTFKNVLGGLKVEAPCRILLPDKRFYGEYYGKASTIGLFELGLKTTVPLPYIPVTYGHWSVYAGFKYMNFVDQNLEHLNTFNAPGGPVRDTWQVYGGISAFF